MDWEELGVFLLFFIPVVTVCFILALRLAIRPFVETLVRALRQPREEEQRRELQAQLDQVRAQLYDVQETLDALRTTAEFDRQLEVRSGGGGS